MSFQDEQDDQGVSLMAYDQYSRWVRGIPVVPKEEFTSLMQCVLRGKEEHAMCSLDRQRLEEAKHARDQIVIALQRLVIQLARRFVSRFQSLELLDLIQEGNLGLLSAIDQYPRNGTGDGFLGYATVYIRQALWRAYLERDGLIVIPEGVGTVLNQARRAQQQLGSGGGEQASLAVLASAVGMREQDLAEVLALYEQRRSFHRLHNPFNEDDAEDLHEQVSVFASWVTSDEEQATPLQQRVHEVVAALVPREREVVTLHYGLEGQVLTCLELAERMGTTEKAIEQVGYRARARLRKTLASLVLGGRAEDEGQVA